MNRLRGMRALRIRVLVQVLVHIMDAPLAAVLHVAELVAGSNAHTLVLSALPS